MTKNSRADSLITLQRTNINASDYLRSLEKEYAQLKKFLPSKIKNVLDIGCGMGGIEVFLYRDFKPKITFLDRDGIDEEVKYGYSNSASKYNLLEETKKFVEKNGVLNASFINIDQEAFPKQKFDLAISLLAMGYHFPLDTYKPNASYLIADVRNGLAISDSWEIIYNGSNYKRVLIKHE